MTENLALTSAEIKPVVIVSIFGRGLWLAQKLVFEGVPVKFIDLTQRMGAYSLQDLEGPFPFLQPAGLSEEAIQFWQKENIFSEQSEGFSVMLSQGPVEFRSSFFTYRCLQLGVKDEVLNILSETDLDTKKKTINKIKHLDLYQTWPLLLANFFASSKDITPVESLRNTVSTPLLNPCFVGNLRPLHQRLAELAKTVPALIDFDLEDISFQDRKKISGLLIKKERSEILECSQVVWFLGTSETRYLSKTVSDKLYHGREKEMQNCWMRWIYNFEGPGLHSQLLLIEDLELPWMQNNFLSLRKDFMTGSYSVWALVPNALRLQKSSIEEKSLEITKTLQNKFVNHKVTMLKYPIEHGQTFKDLGPAIYGNWKEGLVEQNISQVRTNFYDLSSEMTPSQDPGFIMSYQTQIFKKIVAQWNLEVELKRKAMEK